MKKIIPFLFVPFIAFAEFGSTDSANLADIKSGLLADSGSGSFVSQGLTSFIFLNQRVSAWGGNFIKTVGDAARKFVSEFGSDGWFTAVKASIGVIQADVGRINTALTTVNDHLEIIEGDVSSIKDTAESINTFVESIDSSVSEIGGNSSLIQSDVNDIRGFTRSMYDNIILLPNYLNPESIWAQGGFSWAWGFTLNRLATDYSDTVHPSDFLDLSVSVDDSQVWASRIEQYLQALTMLGSSDNEIFVNTLLRESIIQYTQIASTNLLQKILDTNDVWYAKIYDRIPTNLTVVVSNIASNASNDWRYTAATALSSAPVLHDLSPSLARDVNQSFALVPPQLTGDFKADVILLLGNMQQIASSSASVDMDILTNLQVVAGSILSASRRVEEESSSLADKNREIADEGLSHENDLDSVKEVFDLYENNDSAQDMRTTLSLLPSKLSSLNVNTAPTSGTLTIPAFSFAGYELHEYQVVSDYSQFQPFLECVRRVFGLFWFGVSLFLLVVFFRIGIYCLARIASYINPGPFLNNVREANAAYL